MNDATGSEGQDIPRNNRAYKMYKTVKSGRRIGETYVQASEPLGLMVPKLGYPTDYNPGSREKYFVMIRRKRRGEALFHPYDARYVDDPRPYFFAIISGDDRDRIVYEQTVVYGAPVGVKKEPVPVLV